MKWALIGLLVVAFPIIVVLVWGSLLPTKHITTRSARYAQRPAAVWAVLTDRFAFPTWRKDVTSVEVLSPTGWRERGKNNAMTLEWVESTPPHRLVSRIQPGLPFGGTWTYELTPDGDGTALTITEHGEVYNPVFRFVSKFIFGHEATVKNYLEQLNGKLVGGA